MGVLLNFSKFDFASRYTAGMPENRSWSIIMGKKIYKYAGPNSFDRIFASEVSATLKCSLPSDFNDPYELFLTLNFDEKPDALAFYAEVIGSLPQLPTTCFSKSPMVIPMWAHYAQTLSGFAVEFDEKIISSDMPDIEFSDVHYQDAPDAGLTDMLYRASVIGKPRYLYWLQSAVLRAAYFTKLTCWSYEKERRLVLNSGDARVENNILLLDLPLESVTSLIAGPRASPETVMQLQAKAEELGCSFYQLKIGRSTPVPYLVAKEGLASIFDDSSIILSRLNCNTCGEPIAKPGKCPWCEIDDSHREDAAHRNVFRTYQHYGILDEYIKNVQAIGRKKRD